MGEELITRFNQEIAIWQNNDIQSALKEWKEILDAVKDKAPDLYKDFKKEYDELREKVYEAVKETKKVSKTARLEVMLELSDMVVMAENNWIKEKLGFWEATINRLRGINIEEWKLNANETREKSISEYSKEEAIWALNYLNRRYWTDKQWNKINTWNFDKVFSSYNSISEIDNKYEARYVQTELIKIILWVEKWFISWNILDKVTWEEDELYFNNEFLQWFNNELWNYLISIKDFENELKNKDMDDINSKALSCYFLYLEKNWKLNLDWIIIWIWSRNILRLREIWEKWEEKDGEEIKWLHAKRKLENIWILDKINKLIENFSSWEKLIETINSNQTTWQELNLWIEIIKENVNWIRGKLRNDLLEKYKSWTPWKDTKEFEKRLDLFINSLENLWWVEDLKRRVWIIERFLNNNNIDAEIKEITNTSIDLSIQSNTLKLWEILKRINELNSALKELEKSWENKELINRIKVEIEKLEKLKEEINKKSKSLKTSSSLVKKSTEKELREIASWELEVEKLIERVSKRDVEFKEEYKEYLKELWDGKKENKKETSPKENTQQWNENWNSQSYSEQFIQTENWLYSIKLESWLEMILTWPEFEELKDDKDSLISLQDFYQELNDLWLEFVWKNRNFFTKVIDKLNILNWVGEVERLELYNFVWWKIWKEWRNLQDAQNEFTKLKNWAWKDIWSIIPDDKLVPPEQNFRSLTTWVLFNYLKWEWYFNEKNELQGHIWRE